MCVCVHYIRLCVVCSCVCECTCACIYSNIHSLLLVTAACSTYTRCSDCLLENPSCGWCNDPVSSSMCVVYSSNTHTHTSTQANTPHTHHTYTSTHTTHTQAHTHTTHTQAHTHKYTQARTPQTHKHTTHTQAHTQAHSHKHTDTQTHTTHAQTTHCTITHTWMHMDEHPTTCNHAIIVHAMPSSLSPFIPCHPTTECIPEGSGCGLPALQSEAHLSVQKPHRVVQYIQLSCSKHPLP